MANFIQKTQKCASHINRKTALNIRTLIGFAVIFLLCFFYTNFAQAQFQFDPAKFTKVWQNSRGGPYGTHGGSEYQNTSPEGYHQYCLTDGY